MDGQSTIAKANRYREVELLLRVSTDLPSVNVSTSPFTSPTIDLNSINRKEARELMFKHHNIYLGSPSASWLLLRTLHRSRTRVSRVSPTSLTGAASKTDLEKSSASQEGTHAVGAQDPRVGPSSCISSQVAEAQSAPVKHPEGLTHKEEFAARGRPRGRCLIEAERVSQSPPSLAATETLSSPALGGLNAALPGSLDLENVTTPARDLQSKEERVTVRLMGWISRGTLTCGCKSTVDKGSNINVDVCDTEIR
ncbi:hypothetical protein NEOLEDRAFT_1184461 [Neolentinus lepideus HHB14362 ss-1]|uniref:Uncharacterized protein n=1 Tax=Neolentinus lepideus HHB14362 ss-1 TaxID=1314782 RepID=A0A165MEH9_9AGAM|nr:hypothetical protein NEOLEDRAFT_1184461 [Neolentinus lepideus HHB14362 ss-1]